MKTQNLFSPLANTVQSPSPLSIAWTSLAPTEVNPVFKLDWKEQEHICQAVYNDELGTIELHIKKEIQNPKRGLHCYRVSYQYRSPDGNLIAQGTWEPSNTITQAKQLAEFQLQQLL